MIRRYVIALVCSQTWAAEPLPALQAEPEVTVSGLSSGAYMAVQFHVAHSSIVKGAGALAGGPYYCAQGSLWSAYSNCMRPAVWTPLPSLAALRSEAEALAARGRIDSTAHLASARVWLYSGSRDQTVSRDVVEALLAFYSSYKTHTVMVRDVPSGHAMVTLDAGNRDCGATRAPFINDCDYDAAGALLRHLLDGLAPPGEGGGRLLRFDQRPFGDRGISLDEEGFVFIPASCESGRCRVHVAFHGCRQGAESVGDRFAREAGYNRWAAANRMVVLYPQAIARWFPLYNPRGCWDWWGYTGKDYHTRDGAQIRAVKAMLDRLSEPSKSPPRSPR